LGPVKTLAGKLFDWIGARMATPRTP